MAEKFDPKHADKLENPERLVELPPARLIELLELTGAETVVDFGAGTGMYSIPLAEALPGGRCSPSTSSRSCSTVCAPSSRPRPASRPRASPSSATTAARRCRTASPTASSSSTSCTTSYDDPAALAEIVRLLAPGGLLVAAEFARMDRPVGPPNDHVLALDDVRALLAGIGLRELAVYAPGELGLYHNVIVAEKPRP